MSGATGKEMSSSTKGAVMNANGILTCLAICGVAAALQLPQLFYQAAAATERDGQHDFDPLVGMWKFHLKRRLHPLTGSTTWVEFDGTGTCSKVWDGRAELDTVELDGPAGHIEGLTLRTYNPQSHQWSLYWANSKDGTVVLPQIGQFKDGRGEFYAMDTFNGKSILVRYVWTAMTTNSPHFEQSFSEDGGKTWEVNWITDQTRVKASHDAP